MDKKTITYLIKVNVFATVLVAFLLVYLGYFITRIGIEFIMVLEIVIVLIGISYHYYLYNKIKDWVINI